MFRNMFRRTLRNMFRNMTYCMLSGLILTAWSSTLSAAQTASTCTFQKVKIQTDYTLVFGINNVGAIVGTYNPTSGSQAAFIRKSGVVTTIYYPGAAMTSGYGINDNGAIVGSYVMPGIGSPNYGFQWTNGTFVNLSFPGSISTSATGINKTGQVVGSYQDSKGIFHGFKYVGGKYTTINYPNASSTLLSTINNNNEIAGAYTDGSNVEHGFTLQNGKFTTIDYPGGANTIVSQVNDNGVIAGTYYDSAYSTWDGFVQVSGNFTVISDPAASTETALNGINDANVLVGNADYSGAGFKATGCVP